ncbi:MAG TPA: hypothetical protein VNY10_03545 [Roseiarcus sp.]|nr:hypothetical protein [Roseiarcus sp.]
MALPAKRILESVAHLDVEIVAAALIRNDANIGNAARALGVPSGDLRKLVLVDQRLADAKRFAQIGLGVVEPQLDGFERCIATIREGVTPFRCSCCAIRIARSTTAGSGSSMATVSCPIIVAGGASSPSTTSSR